MILVQGNNTNLDHGDHLCKVSFLQSSNELCPRINFNNFDQIVPPTDNNAQIHIQEFLRCHTAHK